MSLTNNVDSIGGYGGGFGGGGSLIEGLIFGALISGNGFGGNRGTEANLASDNATRTLEQTIALLQSQSTDTNAIQSSIADQSIQLGQALASINSNVTDVKLNTNVALAGLSAQVAENKYDTAINLCAIKSELLASQNAGTQRILDAMTCQTIKDLERQLAVAENGGPIVRAGAFVPVNPCQTTEQINIINQNVNAIASRVGQLTDVVSRTAK